MYAYMFLMLFTVGAMTAASMGVLNINNTTQKTMKATDDARILTLWENSIGAALANVGAKGELAPPIGEPATKEIPTMTPPAWISAPRKNAYGYPIVYCPVSQSSKVDLSLPVDSIAHSGGSYKANTSTSTNGHNYVVSSDITLDPSIVRSNVLAFIISPLSDTIPSCSDVTYNSENGRFYVKNKAGVIRVITPASKINNGSDTDDAAALDYSSTLSGWASTSGEDFTIDAATNGGFTSAVAISKMDSNNTVIIKADKVTALKGQGNGLDLTGIDLVLINVDLTKVGPIRISGGTLTLQNSSVGSLQSENSKINLLGTNTINGDTSLVHTELYQNKSAVTISTSGLTIEASKWTAINKSSIGIDSTSKSPFVLSLGSILSLDNSTLSVKGNRSNSDYSILIDPSSTLALSSSTVTLDTKTTWGVFDQGMLQINNSSLIPTSYASYLVGVYDGGRIFANSSSIGNSSKRNAYGIVLESASYASGSQTYIYGGSQCLAGTSYNSYKRTPDSIAYSFSWSCK